RPGRTPRPSCRWLLGVKIAPATSLRYAVSAFSSSSRHSPLLSQGVIIRSGQTCESTSRSYRLQHTGLRPAVHPRVDRVPVAKALGQRTPFAAVLGHIKNSVDHLQVAEAHIASLHRQELLDTIELRGGNFHAA